MNPLELFKIFSGKGGSIEEFIVQQMAGNSNPIINDLIRMAKKGDNKSIENFARNIAKERGINFDKEYSNFFSSLNR